MADAVASQLAKKRIRVGRRATCDPILARASLDAATILYESMQQPPRARDRFLRQELRRFGPGVATRVFRKRGELREKGWNASQALYDAMRLPIADFYTQLGIEQIQAAAANVYGADYGLGSARDVGCAITGGITAIGGGIVSLFTGGAGGHAVGAGGSMVGEAMGCNDKARRAMQDQADAQVRAAELALQQAQVQARTEALKESEKTKRLIIGAAVGGGAVFLIATGWMIVKA